MEGLAVIEQADHVMRWCAPMVVARKKGNHLRICVTYGELNKQVVRERIIMLILEENLVKIVRARVFYQG